MVQQGFVKTKDGARIYLYRSTTPNALLSNNTWLPESQFKIGIDNETPNIENTDLNRPIPINTGQVIDNGTNNLTGTDAAADSIDETEIFKPGGQQFDNTSQNLLIGGSGLAKVWSLDSLPPMNPTHNAGLWMYFRETTPNNVRDGIELIQIRIGQDSNNWYFKIFDPQELKDNWNWLDLGKIEDLDSMGTIDSDLTYFAIFILTFNDTSANWDPGTIFYDLLQTYQPQNLVKNYVEGFPQIDMDKLEVTKRAFLTTVNAVGFNINGYGDFNKDLNPKMGSEATISTRAKTDTDEIIFTVKERILL